MKKLISVINLKVLAVCLISLVLTSCGGGGGGGDSFSGSAILSVDLTPSTIGPGDHTRVRIFISDVHPDGIALKIKFPSGLSYFSSSSSLEVDGDTFDASPSFNQSKDNSSYLVYFFSHGRFGEAGEGILTLELVGVSGVTNGEVAVDSSVDDPALPHSQQFNIDDPQFVAKDSASITVES